MLAGAKGAWLFKTPYTAFPQKGFLAFFPYLLLGKLVGSDGDYHTRIFLFHLFRIVGIGFCLYAVYRFASIFIRETPGRFLALILSTFGGGLGFLYFLGLNKIWSYLPLEFYSPETFGFLSFLSIPHLVWARGFLFIGLAKFLESNSNNSLKESVIIGVLWNLLAFMQPLTVPIGWLILSAYNLVELVLASRRGFNDLKKYLHDHMLKLIVIVLVSSPLVIYTFVAFRLDPFLKAWQSQNVILSPPVIEYFLAYGLIIPFAIVGILNNNTRPKFRLLITWTCLLPFLIYAPYLLQRRLAEGSFVVLSILAINGLIHIRNRLGKLWVSWYLINFVTTFTLLAGSLDVISAKAFPLYLHKEEVQLFESVRKLIPEQSVVLADWEISTLLPAHAPVRVIIGHGPESIRAKLIREQVDLLFLKGNSLEFFKFLKEEQVDYWILSKSKTPRFMKPGSEMEFLNKITENSKYIIYKVSPIIKN
ncbi:hypothetical protein AC812_16660 [Bellilinea caldifistulae]|uniref:Glycosyltransferase RgtA/B/C/D-like domain-containing protein n=2 Tax=Bellilinea caldifistulae TaxID=360411 RepID=A0A0P6X919_9CHLR|nr:hypothetical protein AC812_16660 [Bellilinea caldifistulae]